MVLFLRKITFLTLAFLGMHNSFVIFAQNWLFYFSFLWKRLVVLELNWLFCSRYPCKRHITFPQNWLFHGSFPWKRLMLFLGKIKLFITSTLATCLLLLRLPSFGKLPCREPLFWKRRSHSSVSLTFRFLGMPILCREAGQLVPEQLAPDYSPPNLGQIAPNV